VGIHFGSFHADLAFSNPLDEFVAVEIGASF